MHDQAVTFTVSLAVLALVCFVIAFVISVTTQRPDTPWRAWDWKALGLCFGAAMLIWWK